MTSVEPAPPSTTTLLEAYSEGWFPMGADDGTLHWHNPDPRAVFPLDRLRPDVRLQRFMRQHGYTCTMDTCFEEVMRGCADRPSTWITAEMHDAYVELHRMGHAHCVETWQDGVLVGGIYGVCVGAAFFGESMFSRAPNASKSAFHHLAEHLRGRGFHLFDSQYINDHTRSLGAIEIPRHVFLRHLQCAIDADVAF